MTVSLMSGSLIRRNVASIKKGIKMSSFVAFEDNLLSFSEFCKLDEAFVPSKVEYGTNKDLNNTQWIDVGNSSATFFKSGSFWYAVFVDNNGELGFGISDVKSFDVRSYGFHRSQAANAALVFNQILYVLLERIKSERKEEYAFSGFDEKLGRFYTKVCSNAKVIELIKDAGYLIDERDGYIVLTKK